MSADVPFPLSEPQQRRLAVALASLEEQIPKLDAAVQSLIGLLHQASARKGSETR